MSYVNVLFNIAHCHLKLGSKDKAIEELSRIINHFEDGNKDKLENGFMAKVYNLRGECLIK